MNKLTIIASLTFLSSCLFSKRESLHCDFCKPVNYTNSILYKQVYYENLQRKDSASLRDFYFSNSIDLSLNLNCNFCKNEIGYAFIEILPDSISKQGFDILEIGKIDTICWKKYEFFNEQMNEFENIRKKKLAIEMIAQLKKSFSFFKINNTDFKFTNYQIVNILWEYPNAHNRN